ncbi:MAG TPA: zinc ABC transporter substrate-binding protein [Verrucomicrobiota bacterium]|nr:zinc ABC transporter substrate-binding protein [Verrucomicrobiota bacterium]
MRLYKNIRRVAAVLSVLACVLLCVAETHAGKSSSRKIKVTATVTMITDLVKQVGGDSVEVSGLMGAGVDPHLYKASASDVTKLQNADVIFYCGLLLEGKMQDVLTKLARRNKHVYAVTESIPEDKLLEPPAFSGHYDPHVWFDATLWSLCVDAVVKGLSEYDPAGKEHFEKRGVEYKARLATLHEWALKKVGELPKEKRVLITSHDAFNYFGRAYDFQVVGLQGISTVTETSLADMIKLVEFIKDHKVKAIFVESSVPHKTIERVAKDAGVKVGGELFSDATGTPGEMENGHDLGTYEGMMRHNVNTIVEALK